MSFVHQIQVYSYRECIDLRCSGQSSTSATFWAAQLQNFFITDGGVNDSSVRFAGYCALVSELLPHCR
ncbi:uncharacterized protein PHALS_15234 [Plasmopara halstedii]|uniref:Uncharacterized protein n=1 Tax=Plasmopara halstedii TaxID=4781 RepID=A0A0P1B7P0_PLAHL|nr:uncharacterized protein PHALS_15234 [Plasmopara halstedii]CEG49757.1 hypothetical protein PHALS_15234 [Plasmopara halstedii]|eukprot:XP_024586126.1 hypothetical protein PHALS_15234 [Plasmopara halstedii]